MKGGHFQPLGGAVCEQSGSVMIVANNGMAVVTLSLSAAAVPHLRPREDPHRRRLQAARLSDSIRDQVLLAPKGS